MSQSKIGEEYRNDILGSGIANAVFFVCSTKIELKGLKDLDAHALLENCTIKIELKSVIN